MKSLKGSSTLLKAEEVKLRLSIKDLNKQVVDAKSMKESHAFAVMRARAQAKLAAIPGEIARVEMELARLERIYSNDKMSTKPVTKLGRKVK
jgi:hypothetical protein